MSDKQQPYTPPVRGRNYYAAFKDSKQEITQRKELFSMTITAATQQKGENMNRQSLETEPQFLIDFTFKPVEPSLRLRPEETQLLLAYMGEILKEIEDEERHIIQEEKSATEKA